MKRTLRTVWIFVAMASISLASCSLDPKISENIDYSKEPIKTEAQLSATVVGAYALMTSNKYYGNNVLAFSDARSNAYSDNRTNRLGNVSAFTINSSARYAAETWEQIYLVISETNRALEAEIEDSAEVKKLRGQAYVLRALAHFDLMRLYGQQYVDNSGLAGLGIPYITKYAATDAKVVRGTVGDNRSSIYNDLDKGIELLKQADTKSRIKVSLVSAYAFKARIALFFSNWEVSDLAIAKDNASLAMSTSTGRVIERALFADSYGSSDPQGNTIFEMARDKVFNSGTDGLYYLYVTDAIGYGDLLVNFDVEELFGEDAPKEVVDDKGNTHVVANDIRASQAMIDVVYDELRNVGKYPKIESNLKLIRYEEMILTFIEADYRINNAPSGEGLELLNTLRQNRLLNYTNVTTYDLEDIRLERQKELLFEGFGFEDLMRFHLEVKNPSLIGTDGQIKPVVYGDRKLSFPIPQSEINASGIPQNKGY